MPEAPDLQAQVVRFRRQFDAERGLRVAAQRPGQPVTRRRRHGPRPPVFRLVCDVTVVNRPDRRLGSAAQSCDQAGRGDGHGEGAVGGERPWRLRDRSVTAAAAQLEDGQFRLVDRRRPGAHDERSVQQLVPATVIGYPVEVGDRERAAGLNFTSDAPGADDDGSGVAVALELARLFATREFPGTLVFATVAGEEQGLYGSSFMAAQMRAADDDVQGMFSNDIVGASQAFDGTRPDPFTVRLFVETIPTAVTANQIAILQATGGENDGVTHQLARFVTSVAPFELTSMNIRVIWRRDRYLRASDHVSFQGQGYPAARFTEPRENFDHEHRDVAVINGVQFGDLAEFVDFNYVARVARVNGAARWALATNPGTPKNLQIHVTPPAGFSGINTTTLTWNANPETNLTGYEVVWRETTSADWTNVIPVGNVTAVTLDMSKDNVQFGVRAVDQTGHRSPVAFPQVVTT